MRPSLTFLFCVAILGIVVFLTVNSRHGNRSHAVITPELSDINGVIKSAIGQYQVDNDIYPKSLQDLVQKPRDATNWHGPYLDPPKLPVDRWGHNYFYEYPGKHNTNAYDLFSAGADGRIGTEDDIGNWQ